MALTTVTLTLPAPTGDKTRTAIEIDAGVGDAQKVLITDGLSAGDLATLETIEADGVGATMLAKLTAFVLPNGMTGLYVYGDMIKTIAAVKEQVIDADVINMGAADIRTLYNTYVAYVAAHP